MERMRAVVVMCMVVVAALLAPASPAAGEALGGPSRFVPVTPARILDTRLRLGATGPIAVGGTVTWTVAGRGSVPGTASAVALNVTVTEATGPGFVQVFPTGRAAVGDSSNLNVELAGQTIPNLVVVPVGDSGQLSIHVQGGGQVIADVFGYFEPATSASAGRYVALSPARLLDTREGRGVVLTNPGDTKDCADFATWDEANRWFWTYYERFGDVARLDADGNRSPCESLGGPRSSPPGVRPVDLFKSTAKGAVRVQITGAAPLPAAGVAAAVLNVTATEAAPGYIQVLPTGGAAYGAFSNLNVSSPGQTIPNLVVVPVGADGTVTLYTENPAHLVADVMGYFTDATAPVAADGLFVPLRPTRLLDTRTESPNPFTGGGRLDPGGSRTLQVRGRGGVLGSGAAAAFFNVTATEAVGPGYVQVYPTGAATPGSSSNLNVTASGQTIPNAVLATLSAASGQVTIYAHAGAHIVVDVFGYFTVSPLVASLGVIDFTGLATSGAAVVTYAQAGFDLVASGATWVGNPYGHPGPSLTFQQRAAGTVTITAGGSPFSFQSVDVYSSTTPIPYTIVGKLASSTVLTLSGTVPNTFGEFATVAGPLRAVQVDTLTITLDNSAGIGGNPMGLDTIVLGR